MTFSEIDGIRREINSSLIELQCSESVRKYFGDHSKKNEKVTRDVAEGAVKFFLEKVRGDIDARITMYLYEEAHALKDAVARIDQYNEEED